MTPNATKPELAPCPFCGSSIIEKNSVFTHPETKCILDGVGFMLESSMYPLWNQRHSPWQPIKDHPRDDEEYIGYGWYLYTGDKGITEYYETFTCSSNKKFPWITNEGAHPVGYFTHYKLLKRPSDVEVEPTPPGSE